MVKRARVLAEVEAEAGVPYERTALARRAARSRPRLAVLVLLGAAGFALEAALRQEGAWALGSAAFLLVAWGVWRGRLAGTIAAAFVATLAILVPLGLLAVGPARAEAVLSAFIALWGAAMLPDVALLLRDHELQHAYGRWARRE